MKKFVLAPDSFKGTLSAAEVCAIQESVIRKYISDAEIHAVPMADGGEGMVESFLNVIGGQRIAVEVTAPLSGTVNAVYGILPDGSAVMEMSAAAGLPLVEGRKDPLHASSYGVGEMILDAKSRDIRRILMGLGGSCTNDCGIGMAAALGFRFLDANGAEVEPLAVNLKKIEHIKEPVTLPEVEISAACDVNNPLLGSNGATLTFGSQKGADAKMLAQLEEGMTHFEQVLTKHYENSGTTVPGTGAAGGMGAAILTMLGGTLKPGIEILLDAANFGSLLKNADMVFTGEGRIDWQSACGKVPMGVGLRCKQARVPCIALCGSIGKNAQAVYDCGITSIFSAVKGITTFDEILKTSAEDLEFLTDSVMRTLMVC
ncbi:MAG: glycerate kinase [Oscillospiraceae bacterium]|nr:glycerate kinase [Oscillospiraceae bacterium]